MHSEGFAAFAHADARVLILGSLPGKMSLEKGEYYAQPRNGFWPIMGKLVGAKPELPYKERIAALNAQGIALWDVCKAAYRPGSLDSAIDTSTVIVNDFKSFFRSHTHIRLICFNGVTAAALYERHVLQSLPQATQAIPRTTLPSTSPAHASLSFEQKLARWCVALAGVA